MAITSLDIPSSCTKIGESAFLRCTNLEGIYIPSSVESIGSMAFNGCSSLSFIYFSARCTANTGIAISDVAAKGKIIEKEGAGTSFAQIPSGWEYETHGSSGTKTYLYGGTLYVVGNGAYTTSSPSASWYSHRSSIKKIVVKEGITNIGSYAFADCNNVTEATLNNNGRIDRYAFRDCSALSRVNIGSGVTEFNAEYASDYYHPFSGCYKLATINITDLKAYCDIKNIFYLTDSYYGTAKKKTLMINGVAHPSTSVLEIPEKMTSIPNSAFRYFSNVTKIKLPESMETISSCNFSNYTYLTEITVPSTVSYVGGNAFLDCTSLKTAILNNKGNIGNSAFQGCTSLQTVTLNNKGDIGNSAFLGCTSLQTVTLNNTGIIDYNAFRNCSALTRVNIGSGVTEFNAIDSYPFSGCSKLATVNVTDLKAYCSINKIYYLTDGCYGTAKNKTLMVNGTVLDSTNELDIPEGVTRIERDVFHGFTNLTKIKIPSTVTYLGIGAFCDCPNLKRIVCLAQKCPTVYSFIVRNPENVTLRVPGGKAALYKADNMWKDFKIEECKYDVLELNMYAFEGKYLYTDVKVLSWISSDTDVATVNKLNDVSGRVNAKDFVYDGTTSIAYKNVTIKADLGDYDSCVWKIRVLPNECVLTDGNAYKNTEDILVNGKISYTRNYKANVVGKWQAFYVPFDVEVTDELLEDYDFAKLYMVSYYDANGNGEIEDGEPLRMTFNKLSEGKTLHANMPYFVRVKSAGTKTLEVWNAVLKAAENGSVNCSTTEHEYTLVGIYEPTLMQGRYGVASSGGFTYISSPTTKLGANRWYLEVTSRTGSGADLENYARPIEIYVEGEEEETTGIANLEDNASASHNDKVFTLDGRQVNNTDNLPSGMYIVNGKKVVKK